MVAQVAAILILILGQGHLAGFFVLGQVALWIATLSALVSAADYSRRINVIMATKPAPAPDAIEPAKHANDAGRDGPSGPTPAARVDEDARARDRISA
jgi:hypothetical protein